MTDTWKLETIFGHRFQNIDLVQQALTHRSAERKNYERLEFLGDAVLSCVISGYLLERYPLLREGDLTCLRASLVRKESLADIADKVGLGQCLHLGEGERRSGGRRCASILADALEAVFGAIYLDAGFDKASQCILNIYQPLLTQLRSEPPLKDPKTRLQEYLQSLGQPLPEYLVRSADGAAHERIFTVECRIPAIDTIFSGQGTSRRMAEQQAALQMLTHLSIQ